MSKYVASLISGFFFALMLGLPAIAYSAPSGQDIEVNAKKVGDLVIIDVNLIVLATQKEAWDVLIDYDHMAQFLPNLQSSKIISRTSKQLKVAQKGGVSHGPISISFDVVREVELKPYSEIVSRIVSGDLKKVDGTTRLVPAGESTRITFHSESIPNVWVPPGIGPALIESETRDQFNDLRSEILRRKEASKN